MWGRTTRAGQGYGIALVHVLVGFGLPILPGSTRIVAILKDESRKTKTLLPNAGN